MLLSILFFCLCVCAQCQQYTIKLYSMESLRKDLFIKKFYDPDGYHRPSEYGPYKYEVRSTKPLLSSSDNHKLHYEIGAYWITRNDVNICDYDPYTVAGAMVQLMFAALGYDELPECYAAYQDLKGHIEKPECCDLEPQKVMRSDPFAFRSDEIYNIFTDRGQHNHSIMARMELPGVFKLNFQIIKKKFDFYNY